MKGRHRRPGLVGFAVVLAALLVVTAAAVAVRAFAERSPIEPSANAALSKAPEGSGASGPPSPAAGSPATEQPKRGRLLIHGRGR